jgi:hypothetical protein
MLGLIPIATFTELPLVEIFGSGKLGTPCARMHAENAIALLPGCASPEPELGLDDALVDELVDAVLDPRCATPEPGELPPQPATSSATAASAAAVTTACFAPRGCGGPAGAGRLAMPGVAFMSSLLAGWMLRARGVLRDGRLHHGDRRCNRAVTENAPRSVLDARTAG